MPVARRTKRVLALGLAAALALAAAAASTIQRIPTGRAGIASSGLVSTGWTLHAPFAPLPTLPVQGELVLDGIAFETSEGSTIGFRLQLHYTAKPEMAPQFLLDIRRDGLPGAITALTRRVLKEVAHGVDVETLISEPSRIEGPLTAALHAAGMTPVALSLRSTMGDTVMRRRRTDEARALARDPEHRVLVIGWDGADWHTAEPLMIAGRMPNLSRLTREGASGNLRSYDPMFSPLLWTTVATGKPPTEHGIADFLVKDPKTGERHPITSDFRKVKALWNILGEFDRTSSWIGWWASFPAESIRGTLVTDYLAAAVSRSGADAAALVPGIASPAGALSGETKSLIGAAQISQAEVASIIPLTDAEYRAALEDIAKPAPKGDKTRVEDPVVFVMRVLAQARTYHNIALAQIRAGVPFVAVYYEAIDMMGHGFQQYLPPKMSFVSDDDFRRFHDAVPHFYVWQDALLGELMRAAGRDTITLLLSDHGFRTGNDRPNFSPSIKGQPEEWHRDWGIVALHGPGIATKKLPPSSILDIAPTLLYVAGLPLADDMPGRLLADAFDPVSLKRRSPAKIKSYELLGTPLAHAAAVKGDPEVMREMMANLKALGYVGGSDEVAPPAADGDAATTQFFFHRNLAVSYVRQGRFRDAESELLQANERQPRAKTYAMLSEARASDGRFAEAATALEDGWTRVPAEMDPQSLLWIVELDLLAGGPAVAATAATRWAPKMTPGVRHAVDGRLAEEAGQADSAAELYRQALTEDPLLVRIALRLQSLESAAGRPFALEPFLVATVAAHPEVDTYWDLAGQLALARNDVPSAIDRFRRATEIEPDNPTYLGHAASAYAAAGRKAEARDALSWAMRFPPREAEGWMALGSAWDRLGETDQAVGAFGKAGHSPRAGPGADLGAALALARAGRTAEARRVLDAGLLRYPESGALRQLSARLGDR